MRVDRWWTVLFALAWAGCASCDGCAEEAPEDGVGLQFEEASSTHRAFPNAAPAPARPSALPRYAAMTVGDRELGVGVATTTAQEVSAITVAPAVTITIEPRTTFLRSAVSPAAVALGVGALLVERAPEEAPDPSPVRVATLAGTLELTGAAKVYVATNAEGVVYVAVLEGRISFATEATEGAPNNTQLSEGDALTSLGRQPTVAKGPTSVDAARAASEELRGVASLPDPSALASALEADILLVEEERARGRALRTQRRASASARESTGPSLDDALEAHEAGMATSVAATRQTYERAEALAARLASVDASEASRYLSTLAPTAARVLPLLRR